MGFVKGACGCQVLNVYSRVFLKKICFLKRGSLLNFVAEEVTKSLFKGSKFFKFSFPLFSSWNFCHSQFCRRSRCRSQCCCSWRCHSCHSRSRCCRRCCSCQRCHSKCCHCCCCRNWCCLHHNHQHSRRYCGCRQCRHCCHLPRFRNFPHLEKEIETNVDLAAKPS